MSGLRVCRCVRPQLVEQLRDRPAYRCGDCGGLVDAIEQAKDKTGRHLDGVYFTRSAVETLRRSRP